MRFDRRLTDEVLGHPIAPAILGIRVKRDGDCGFADTTIEDVLAVAGAVHPKLNDVARQRRIGMRRQRLTIISGELTGRRVEDFEPAIVDPVAVDHANIFGTGAEAHSSRFDPLGKRRLSRHGTFVRQDLPRGHPVRMPPCDLGHTIACITNRTQARTTAMVIHLGTNCVVEQVLVDPARWNHDLRCLCGYIPRTGIGHSGTQQQGSAASNSKQFQSHPQVPKHAIPHWTFARVRGQT